MSFMKESIREGLAELFEVILALLFVIIAMGQNLHFNNAVVGADVQNLAAELVSQTSDSIEMFVLVSQGLTVRQVTRVEFGLRDLTLGLVLLAFGEFSGGGDLAVVLEQFLEELGTQDADLGEEQLALDQSRVGVIKDSPDGDQVVQLTTGLLNDTVLTLQDDGHARQILHLGVTDDETINVEATGGENTRHAGQHTGFVLHQTVQDMALGRVGGRGGSFVENGRNSRRGVPLRRSIGDGQGERRPAMQGLVGQS